ncbi:MAG: cytochrome c oxidase assembly protein [Gammaproteobacteria bacterium]|nr:cytochrome c oxidase assembly protein [Gammaproteobacteria bacterium]|tara:strand:- start:1279 stop:1821 length:543 start_codon:yes stop_codon:yes gene_type:complete
MKEKKLNIKTAKKLIFICFSMFLFSFALIPLYNVICDVTGLNGNTSNLKEKVEAYKENVSSEKLNIQFISHQSNDNKLLFKPSEFEMIISPGKVYSTMYVATNKTNTTIVGQAVPSVSPNEASKYLKKIECFCFEEQTFKPGEVVKLPLYFAIDEKLPNRIKTVTLSYSFFEFVNVSKKN